MISSWFCLPSCRRRCRRRHRRRGRGRGRGGGRRRQHPIFKVAFWEEEGYLAHCTVGEVTALPP